MSHPKYTHRDEEEPATVYYYNKQNKTQVIIYKDRQNKVKVRIQRFRNYIVSKVSQTSLIIFKGVEFSD